MIRKKWTNKVLQVHQVEMSNGQVKSVKVADLEGISSCPLKRNSRGHIEGTLPGKAA